MLTFIKKWILEKGIKNIFSFLDGKKSLLGLIGLVLTELLKLLTDPNSKIYLQAALDAVVAMGGDVTLFNETQLAFWVIAVVGLLHKVIKQYAKSGSVEEKKKG